MMRSWADALPHRANDDWATETRRIRQANRAGQIPGGGIFLCREAAEVLRANHAVSKRAVCDVGQGVGRGSGRADWKRLPCRIKFDGFAATVFALSGAGGGARAKA